MTERKSHKRADRADGAPREKDVMRGRSLAGAEYGANEDEQTAERNRVGRDRTDEAGESIVTDAELEAGEENAGE